MAFAAPPQHGKTEASLRSFIYFDRFHPGKRHAYVTFNQTRAQEVAKQFQFIAQSCGALAGGTLAKVELRGGSTVKFTSVHGDLTGSPIDGVGLFDDLIAGPAEARSASVRRHAIDWWKSVARARRHVGASFFVMATRWHVDDPTGYFIKSEGWQYVNLKCIAEPKSQDDVDDEGRVISDPLHRIVGESLWKRKPAEFFKEERADRYWWAAQYQGEPVPAGGSVFNDNTNLYRELPKRGYRGSFGIDLAYSTKTHADWSILIELWREETDDPEKPLFYVVDVQRKQVAAPDFALVLKAKRAGRPWPMRWYAAGTEKGSADFLNRQGLDIDVIPPKGDKFVRALPVSAVWNAGRILLPDPEHFRNVQWLSPFLDVVQNFTGVNDDHDDDVDALAAAFDELADGGEDIGLTVVKHGPSL